MLLQHHTHYHHLPPRPEKHIPIHCWLHARLSQSVANRIGQPEHTIIQVNKEVFSTFCLFTEQLGSHQLTVLLFSQRTTRPGGVTGEDEDAADSVRGTGAWKNPYTYICPFLGVARTKKLAPLVGVQIGANQVTEVRPASMGRALDALVVTIYPHYRSF